MTVPFGTTMTASFGTTWRDCDGSTWPRFKRHREKKGLVRAGAKSSRHTTPRDQGGATSRRPSGSNSSRPSQRGTATSSGVPGCHMSSTAATSRRSPRRRKPLASPRGSLPTRCGMCSPHRCWHGGCRSRMWLSGSGTGTSRSPRGVYRHLVPAALGRAAEALDGRVRGLVC